jgi:hypothetical protein
MRRLVGWIGGALGGITAYRFVRRQQAAEVAAERDARAEELRAKLSESRAAETVAESEPESEPVEEPPSQAEEPESPDERRRRVHEEGRAALDEMRSD